MHQTPDPPPVGLFTKWVLENPYPLGAILLAMAIVMAWTALRSRPSSPSLSDKPLVCMAENTFATPVR